MKSDFEKYIEENLDYKYYRDLIEQEQMDNSEDELPIPDEIDNPNEW